MDKKIVYWIIGIILLFIVLNSLGIINLDLFSSYKPNDLTFTQYTGRFCTSSCPTWSREGSIEVNNIAIIPVEDDIFKFVAHPTDMRGMSQPQVSGASLYRGCAEYVEVFKNNNLIDIMAYGYLGYSLYYPLAPDGTPASQINTERVNSYNSTTGKTRIQANLMTTSTFYVSSCTGIQNDYSIVFSPDVFDISLENPKNFYYIGDNITFPIKIKNNFQQVNGKLKINYRLNTILGDLTKDTTQEIIIPKGTSTHQINLASTQPVSSLTITPSLEMYLSTSQVTGLNYPVQGTIRPISHSPQISLGSFSGNTTSLSILIAPSQCSKNSDCLNPCEGIISQCLNNQCVYSGQCTPITNILSCKDTGCPTGYACNISLNVCVGNPQENGEGNIIDNFGDLWNTILFEWKGIKFSLPILLMLFGVLVFILKILRKR